MAAGISVICPHDRGDQLAWLEWGACLGEDIGRVVRQGQSAATVSQEEEFRLAEKWQQGAQHH